MSSLTVRLVLANASSIWRRRGSRARVCSRRRPSCATLRGSSMLGASKSRDAARAFSSGVSSNGSRWSRPGQAAVLEFGEEAVEEDAGRVAWCRSSRGEQRRRSAACRAARSAGRAAAGRCSGGRRLGGPGGGAGRRGRRRPPGWRRPGAGRTRQSRAAERRPRAGAGGRRPPPETPSGRPRFRAATMISRTAWAARVFCSGEAAAGVGQQGPAGEGHRARAPLRGPRRRPAGRARGTASPDRPSRRRRARGTAPRARP